MAKKRIEWLREISVKDAAALIVKHLITAEHCETATHCEDPGSCPHEMLCAIRWLEGESEESPFTDMACRCRVCGCTDSYACPGGCYWVEEDLCSECVDIEAAIERSGT